MVSLQQALKDFVSSRVKVPDDDRKKSVAVVKRWVEEELVSRMRKVDALFDLLYGGIYYAGSSYEGLKVGKANEFDLNILLKLPFRPCDVLVKHRGVPHGFVLLQLTKSVEALLGRHTKWTVLNRLTTFFRVSGNDHAVCLSREKLSTWFQSVVDRTLHRYGSLLPGKVIRRCSGPAATLVITSISDKCPDLDVDLVPVIPLDTFPGSVNTDRPSRVMDQNRKSSTNAPTLQLSSKRKTCFVVPKQAPDHLISGKPCENHAWKFFRVSMPDVEREMMNNRGCVKMLVKIFKAIRDKEYWHFLPSYYIKTVFMWKIREEPNCDWSEANLAELFKMMLSEFVDVFHRRNLPHIFFPDFNLLASVPDTSLTTVLKRLEVMSRGTSKTMLKPKFASYFETIGSVDLALSGNCILGDELERIFSVLRHLDAAESC